MCKKWSIFLKQIFFVVVSLFVCASASESSEVPRKILTFYDSTLFPDHFFTAMHQHAAVIFNHLGMEVIYRPINQALPSREKMKEYQGIITWFRRNETFQDSVAYCQWMQQQISDGKKYVILEQFGFDLQQKECQVAFDMLGAEFRGEFSNDPLFFEVVSLDLKMVEFERKINFAEELVYYLIHSKNNQSKVYLNIKRTDIIDSESALVFTSPQGGFVSRSYVIFQDPSIDKIEWRLNPFLFFNEAFGLQGLPRPDTNIINGTRIFYSHIDGDGIVNISYIDQKTFSGEVILEEILKKYTDIPMTVSIISGYLEMPKYHTDRVMKLYEEIFNLPNVEPASHGRSHPLVWKKEKLALEVPEYQYSHEGEIAGSINDIQGLLDQFHISKKVELFLWTGDCLLPAEALAVSYQHGYLNMNGGDSRNDKTHKSYGYVYPLGIRKGGYLQVYSSAPNENIFTNLWKGPYYGFRSIIETFKNLETPILMKPVNVYYHFYSGERIAGLNALKEVYDYALSQKIFPVWASYYIQLVSDFFKTKIDYLGEGYRVTQNGNLKTIRFDEEDQFVDLERSKGVLGFKHYQNNLYIFLDESEEHEIYLTHDLPHKPYLEEASFFIKDFAASKIQVSFQKKGWFRSEAILKEMMPHSSYLVRTPQEEFVAQSDEQGTLSLIFKHAENEGPYQEVLIELES